MQDARCRMQDAGCKMQDAGCKMQDAGCKMQDTGYKNNGYSANYWEVLGPVSDRARIAHYLSLRWRGQRPATAS